jgi:hypothetical protein
LAPLLLLHLTFPEYLTACYLARLINDNGWVEPVVPFDGKEQLIPAKNFVDRKAWLPTWQEVILLLSGKLDDPVLLLEMLADDGKDDIFRHRLALAALCLPEIKEIRDTT